MSAISDPDRLERLAVYVSDAPPNTTPQEVADALADAATRIRSLQERLTAIHALQPEGVSIEQLAATWRAVWMDWDAELPTAIVHLRAVKP